jgi:hypothetical protein
VRRGYSGRPVGQSQKPRRSFRTKGLRVCLELKIVDFRLKIKNRLGGFSTVSTASTAMIEENFEKARKKLIEALTESK